MKAIVIDDEVSAQNVLLDYLTNYFPNIVSIRAVCSSGTEGIQKISELNPDIVFLDVQMPDMTGFEMLQTLDFPNIDFKVVFCSSHGENAIKAFRFSAADFLVKPIQLPHLIEAVTRVREAMIRSDKALEVEKYKALLDNVTKQNSQVTDNRKLVLATIEGTHLLNTDDVIRLEADGNYTIFYSTSHKPIMAAKQLGEYDDHPLFYRVHRSRTINPKHVTKITRNETLILHMSDGTVVEVSRGKKEEVQNYLKDFIAI